MMHRSIMIESTIEKKYDFTLMVSTLLLLGWGTVMIYSTSAPFAEMQYQNSHFFLQKHLVHILLGIAVLALGLKIDYHLWQKYASWMMLGMLLVMILVLIPEIGHEVKGGRRWLRFGSIGFQPVELLKIRPDHLCSCLPRTETGNAIVLFPWFNTQFPCHGFLSFSNPAPTGFRFGDPDCNHRVDDALCRRRKTPSYFRKPNRNGPYWRFSDCQP